jgi:hypothetical protein
MSDKKNWIQGAVKKKGALTASAKKAHEGVQEFAEEHKHSKGKLGERSRFALIMKHLHSK